MIATATLLVSVSLGADADSDLLTRTEQSFAAGVELRADAATARKRFAEAAAGYDTLWRHGHRSPDLALDRARAHEFADDLPEAIVALREGLAAVPYDRRLETELDLARRAVEYPKEGGLTAPRADWSIASRMTPTEAFVLFAAAWLGVWLASARYRMSRARVWLGLALLLVVGLLFLGGLWYRAQLAVDEAYAKPAAVVAAETVLRKGNSDDYPARLDHKLPRGMEVIVVGGRGGWVRVELPGGVVGWLPETAIIRVDDGVQVGTVNE